MKENSRIRFNPATEEVEVEGSEEFVKKYFKKLQALLSESSNNINEKQKTVKPAPARKVKRSAKKEPGAKRVTNISAVMTLIQASTEGMSTDELKKKTGLAEHQIWAIVDRAAKQGKIRKLKRGLYGAVQI